ncbi:MAG: hypothetical protein JNM17_25855 [Archangium sp.]|nr:hypothetical protein [Archangium sp.]
MHREFSIIRMKEEAKTWEFPLSWDEVTTFSPMAGPFSEFEMHRLHYAIATFPRAKPIHDQISSRGCWGSGRRAWNIHGVEAWLTSDGCLFVDGLMDVDFMYSFFKHLRAALPHLLVEDRITNVVHDEVSLRRLSVQTDRAA